MAVYRNIEVDIPQSHVTIEKQAGGKPAAVRYVLEAPYDREKGYACPKRTTIGYVCPGSTTKMNPTTQYADIFPAAWEEVSKESYKPKVKKVGMFTALQAINAKTGIKDILDNTYGFDKSNALIDYVMYSIIHHTDNPYGFTREMRDELLFSEKPYSDTWYARLSETAMTNELDLLFRKRWALQCKEDGAEEVWLCIDGSNDDCQSKGVDIAEHAHAESGENIDIVSFAYAVTEDGKPVTYEVYHDGLVDAKALQMVIGFLRECGIQVKGVILERGYCDADALKYLTEQALPYIIMTKGTPDGYNKIVEADGDKIKLKVKYLIPYTCLFGCQEPVQLFKNYAHQDYLTIFYDYLNGSERITTLLKNLYHAMDDVNAGLKKGTVPNIKEEYQELITIYSEKHDGEDIMYADINEAALQAAIDEKGIYSVVTSDAVPPERIHQLCSCRNASETQYMLVKSQLGYGVTKVHCIQRVRAKFAVGFIASVIRYEIEKAAKTIDRDVNQIVLEMEKLEAQKINNVYTCAHNENECQKAFFHGLEANLQELLDESVKFENDRLAGRTVTSRRRKPGPQKKHRKQYDEKGNVIPRKPGVKPGTKRGDVNKDGTPRKKPGLKEGTKMGKYNKDGSLRKKPGPKPKSAEN